ncbi:MAG: helix-turn-helix domain-containing protein [Mycobacterium sp.]
MTASDHRGPAEPQQQLLTAREVAALFRVGTRTVLRWAAAGHLRTVRTPGGHCRFAAADVNALRRPH